MLSRASVCAVWRLTHLHSSSLWWRFVPEVLGRGDPELCKRSEFEVEGRRAGARNRRRWPKNLTGTGPGTRTRGGGGFVTDQLQNFFHSTHILSVFATNRRRSTFSVTSKLTERLQDVSTLPGSTHCGNPVVPVSVEGHKVNACTLPATRSTKPHQPGGVFLALRECRKIDLVLVEFSLNSLTG